MSDSANNLVEVNLKINPNGEDNFLSIRETLTRIGVASEKVKNLYQSCHILHRGGRYFIVHFKEMFVLDGRKSSFSDEDKARRNTIVNLLEEWDLIDIVDPEMTTSPVIPSNKIKIIKYSDKNNWNLVPKYKIGTKRK